MIFPPFIACLVCDGLVSKTKALCFICRKRRAVCPSPEASRRPRSAPLFPCCSLLLHRPPRALPGRAPLAHRSPDGAKGQAQGGPRCRRPPPPGPVDVYEQCERKRGRAGLPRHPPAPEYVGTLLTLSGMCSAPLPPWRASCSHSKKPCVRRERAAPACCFRLSHRCSAALSSFATCGLVCVWFFVCMGVLCVCFMGRARLFTLGGAGECMRAYMCLRHVYVCGRAACMCVSAA